MAFNKKTWKDQLAEFTNRYIVTPVTDGTTNIVRHWGRVSQVGDRINASSMNDLENRVDQFALEVTEAIERGATGIIIDRELNPTSMNPLTNAKTTEKLAEKMVREVYTLSQVGGSWSLKGEDGEEESFADFYNTIRDESKYVVVLIGNSKLRPQYVSTNEIHCDGEDRDSQGTMFLRMIMTPSSLYYTSTRMADKTDLGTQVEYVVDGTTLRIIVKE